MSNKLFQYAGVAASVVLIALGVGAIAVGSSGHGTVRDNLAKEQIVGTPDMTPSAIAAEAKAAGLKNVDVPACSVAGRSIDTGARARCFAGYMRIHTLEATGGQVYADMGRYLDKNGEATDNEKLAAIDPETKKPVENGARNIWVNETALSTALNTSYFAESVATFAIVMGVALVLVGIGFLVLTLGPLHEMLTRRPETAGSTVPAAQS
jgi:hypothetical protein